MQIKLNTQLLFILTNSIKELVKVNEILEFELSFSHRSLLTLQITKFYFYCSSMRITDRFALTKR